MFAKETPSYIREAQKMSLGLERLLDVNPSQLLTTNFPPYDILRINDSEYVVSFAVAGYTEADIDITITDGNLVVTGGQTSRDENSIDSRYVHKGIATRTFTKVIPFASNLEVTEANLENGILSIIIKGKESHKIGIKVPITPKDKPESKRQILMEYHHDDQVIELAKAKYSAFVANNPTIHSNRFCTWDELSADTQDTWLSQARKEII